MILGTVTDTPFRPTSFGLEHRVSFDVNLEAKSASGQEGPAISDQVYYPGDRVALEYRSTSSYGLWFIVKKVDQ
jgi:hypothetical protein